MKSENSIYALKHSLEAVILYLVSELRNSPHDRRSELVEMIEKLSTREAVLAWVIRE